MNVYMWRITVETSTKICRSWFDKLYPNLWFCVAIAESVNATSKNHFASNAKPSNRTSFYFDVFMTVNQTLAGCCLIIKYWSRTLYERNSLNLHARLNHSPVNCTEVSTIVKYIWLDPWSWCILKFCLNLEPLTTREFMEQDIFNVLWTFI